MRTVQVSTWFPKLAALAFLSVSSFAANPAESTSVAYAGVAYLGSFEFIEENYAHALALNQATEAAPGQLDQALKAALEAQPPEQFQLGYGLANLRDADAIVLAVAFDKEQVSIEKFMLGNEPQQKIIAEVSAQILLYDFHSLNLVANYPIALAINHVVRADTGEMEAVIDGLFARIYLGDAETRSIVQRIADKVATLAVQPQRGFRFQLRSLTLSDEAATVLPAGLGKDRAEQYLGQFFSAHLSEQHPVPVLPYVVGYAFGNQMPGRFANGEVFSLQYPEPDYVFDLEITRTLKNQDAQGLLYGVQAAFGFHEGELDRLLVEDDLRYGVYKADVGAEGQLDEWAAYEDAIENLIIETVTQLGDPDRQWFSTHARNANESFSRFQDNKRLFNEYLR